MPLDAVVDNDVLIKCACYDLLRDMRECVPDGASLGVLDSARFVVSARLQDDSVNDGTRALESFTAFLRSVVALEPTEDELALATDIEEAAAVAGVDLDHGESQLCAITVYRTVRWLITGDKRAIRGFEQLIATMAGLSPIVNRVVCLEQVISTLVARLGGATVRDRICSEPRSDRTLSICFECTNATTMNSFKPVGLESYVNDLRAEAPNVLGSGLPWGPTS
jgi:hypothetical protein